MQREDFISERKEINTRLVQLYEYLQASLDFNLPNGTQHLLPALEKAIAAVQAELLRHGELGEAGE